MPASKAFADISRFRETRKVMARKTAKPSGWNRALAYPIKLRDGDVISTMAQAALRTNHGWFRG